MLKALSQNLASSEVGQDQESWGLVTRFLFLLCAKSLQSCPAICDSMDCSPPGSLSMGFSRQEYWSGLPFPSPGTVPTQRSNPCLSCRLHWQVGSLPLAPPGKPFIYWSYTCLQRMTQSSQKDRVWRAWLSLPVGVNKSSEFKRFRREKSVEERSWVGAEAASHFALFFFQQ